MTVRKRNNRLVVILFFLIVFFSDLTAQIDFSYQSDYSYLKGKDAASLPGTWINPGFDCNAWQTGKSPFRYGDGAAGTELPDMQNNYTTVFLKSTFECANKDLIKELTLTADFDDGFVIWINGVLALSNNAPSNPSYNSVATANHESGTGNVFIVSASSLNLINGINSIAILGLNVNLPSTDFYFDLEIHAEKNLPELIDTVGVGFSVRSGFYDSPFNLVITSPDPSLDIIFTLDGSNPQNSATGIILASPATVLIDPESSFGRPVSPAVIVRVSLSEPGYKPSIPASGTYIFAEKVKTQAWPGGGWPAGRVNGQVIDLAMDSKVVNDPEYSSQIINSLKGIPSISIITDLKNLFDPASGIYVNALGHGLSWERECSLELINPDRSQGFNVNAGLRIRGGWSRNDDFPKHAFRIFFREKYGNDKLRFPLFGEEGADEFDKIDLRTDQNYAWSNGYSTNSMVREVFSRDSQKDMNQPYTRSRYYHLYLNGMYWGLFQTQERSEARYAQTYFGGSEDEYDVVKVNTENGYSIEAGDGTLDSWQTLYNMCQKGFVSNADYFKIEGKDQYGKPMKGGKIMVDLDNLIDFMMVIFYTGNFDSPTASFMLNKGSNNFYAIDNREDNSKGFTFFVHDAEHSLFDEPHNPGIGLYEDRVNIGTRTDNMKMEVYDFIKFHPQWLHFKLSANPEYRIRFAGRAWKHLSEGGVFSPKNALDRINNRIGEVDIAVVAESARWGDSKTSSVPYTKNRNWLPEVNKIRNNFIPFRTNIVIDQLKVAGLYPNIKAPVIKTADGIIAKSDHLIISALNVGIENPNTSGTIYYTLDGTDPRKQGGSISQSALFSLNTVNITVNTSAVLTARVLDGSEWSAARSVNFIGSQADYSDLKVTELHYHPFNEIAGYDTTEGKDLEFIEFKNTGKNAVNLSGLAIDSAVSYTFPSNRLLPPKQFYVVASKPSKFYDYYGLVASGNFQGNFSNAGEEVLLNDQSGNDIIRFSYGDSAPWPSEADGGGFSLSSKEINPAGDPLAYSYWTLSVKKDGTPFADNLLVNEEDPGLSGDGSLLVYPNPTAGLIRVQLISEDEITNMNIMLFTTTGRLVKRAIIGNPGLLDLSDFGLANGVYILKVSSLKHSSRIAVILAK